MDDYHHRLNSCELCFFPCLFCFGNDYIQTSTRKTSDLPLYKFGDYCVYFKSFLSAFRFQPDKGFSGIDSASSRNGPVQFEKDEEDPFQVDKLFQDAKLGGKRSDKHDKYVF